MVARKKPTPYSKLSPSAKKKAKPASYKGRVGGVPVCAPVADPWDSV